MSPLNSNEVYSGIERRASIERRSHADRRNLMRYESLGSNRRVKTYRRKEDGFWSAESL